MEFDVKMEPQKSILKRTTSYEEMAKIIASHLMESRGPAVQPYWQPYMIQEGIDLNGDCKNLDANTFYCQSKQGDVIYAAGDLVLSKDYNVWINVIGMVKVYLDGECLFSSWEEAEQSVKNNTFISIPIWLKGEQRHRLVIKAVCTVEGFGFTLNVSAEHSVGRWAKNHEIMVKLLYPTPGFQREEGLAISKLYTNHIDPKSAYEKEYELDNIDYVYPKRQKEGTVIDFTKLYYEGNTAFAYSVAKYDTAVRIKVYSPTKILINGKKDKVLNDEEQTVVQLKRGDKLLLKSVRGTESWGLDISDAEGIGLPFLETDRWEDFKVALCGPFFQKGLEVKLPPEYAENIFKPFPDGNGGQVFWRLQNAHLRANLDSGFFGMWHYPVMLGFLGILRCGELFDQPEYVNYFMNQINLMVNWGEYAMYDYKTYGQSLFLRNIGTEGVLDDIGTMGMNLIEAYRVSGNEQYLSFIRLLQWNIYHKVPRLEDGTFRRTYRKSMWADDFYMSSSFLAPLYGQFRDSESLKEFICQLRGNLKRLYMPDKKIFSHIYFWEEGVNNNIPWGRGNGWIAFALSEMLLRLSEENLECKEINKAFCEFCEGLVKLQDECGMWHQVLDREESYLETSCTVMFTLAFYRGVRNGWFKDSALAEKIEQAANKGLKAILDRCLEENGTIYGVCRGSGCSKDPVYYYNLSTIKDDNHGAGVVLMLLCELAEEQSMARRS